MKHNPNLGPNLGTVLVELTSEDCRGKLMKTKKNLMNHPSMILKNLIIKNAMSPAELKAQNTHFGMLKMITGNNDFFIAGNGAIKKKDPDHLRYQAHPGAHHAHPGGYHQQPHQQPQHVQPQAHFTQQQEVPKPTHPLHPQTLYTQAGFAQTFSQPPPKLSQTPQQQGYPKLPQFTPQVNYAPQLPIIRTTPISEADLLGEFDFSSAQSCAVPRPRSAESNLPSSTFDNPQPGPSNRTTQMHENLTHQ